MPITKVEIYQQVFEAHRHASDFRAKVMGGWAAVFTSFAGMFVWTEANRPDRAWMVAVAGLLLNLMMWLADWRNRPALERAKAIGKAIEGDTAEPIPPEWCFFAGIERGVRHSSLIDLFGILSSGAFLGAALAL